MAEKRKRAPRLGPTKQRKEAVIAAYRRTGVYAHAAEVIGLSTRRLREWRAANPDFEEELTAAGEELSMEIGQCARGVTHQHLLDALSRRQLVKKRQQAVILRGGRGQPDTVEVVTLIDTEPMSINASLVRAGLTKLDPAWTHPPKDIRDGQGAELTAQLERIWANMEADEAALEADAAAAAALAAKTPSLSVV